VGTSPTHPEISHVSEIGSTFSPGITTGMVALSDAIFMVGSGFGIYFIYVGHSAVIFPSYLTVLLLGTFFIYVAFYFSKLYQFDAVIHLGHCVTKMVFLCILVFMALIALGFALKISASYSRIWFFSWALTASTLILIGRIFCFYLIRRMVDAGRLTRNVALVGGTEQAEKILQQIDAISEPWNNIIGVFDDRSTRISKQIGDYPVLGTIEDLVTYSRENRVDDVIVTLPLNEKMRVTSVVNVLSELPLNILLGLDMSGLQFPSQTFSFLGGIPMLDVANKPMGGWNRILKGIEDRVLAFLFLIVLSPIMALVAIVIKLESPGPVLFIQPRYGFNNREFPVFKFRSMRQDRPPETGVPQATKNDPRVTRIGAFLRRSSLDELPQLINVLMGTMSLVGPRPHAVQHNKEYAAQIDGYFARHKVKPGITGWAQVNGLRGETETLDKMEDRVKFDLYYIENWSLAFDIKILVMTAMVVFFQKTAY
jgi:Undecaprenyl-phosphate glucose phosphotransferase